MGLHGNLRVLPLFDFVIPRAGSLIPMNPFTRSSPLTTRAYFEDVAFPDRMNEVQQDESQPTVKRKNPSHMIDMNKLQPIYNKIETQNLSSPASRNPWFLWVYIALIIIGLAYLTIKEIKDRRYYSEYYFEATGGVIFAILKAVGLLVVLSTVYFGFLTVPDNEEEVAEMKDKALYSYVQKETGVDGLECEDRKSCVFGVDGEIHSGELKFIKDDRYVVLIDKATNKVIQPTESLTDMAR